MSEGLDIEQLRHKLENRLQVSLSAQRETVDGGSFDTLRLSNLAVGNGFAILLARTHRQFEASFKADNFAGALLRTMADVDAQKKMLFLSNLAAAESDGCQVYVAINDTSGEAGLEVKDRWSKIEIDVSKRLPSKPLPSDMTATAFTASLSCLALVLTLADSTDLTSPPKDNSVVGLPEGAKMKVEVNRYERSPANRTACLRHYGYKCMCCGFDFVSFYGELGDGYIEVHHRTPVSRIGANYVVDPIEDLVPLCSNCHAMVHRTDPPTPVEALRSMIETRNNPL